MVIMAETEIRPAPTMVSSTATSRPAPSTPKTYTVKPEDTLWAIAKKTLGDGGRWREIYNNNTNVIGKDPNLIFPGQVLRIA